MAMGYSRQLVVLVGGRGTRLGAAAAATPKPLMPIGDGRLFLDYFLDASIRQGFDEILLLAGHHGEQVRERYDNVRISGANINVLIEPEPMGTGGALTFACGRLAPTFVVANGDTLFDTNIRAVDSLLHQSSHLDGVLALRNVDDAGRYGSVDLGDDGLIAAFNEKIPQSLGQSGLISGGIYALRRKVIEGLKPHPMSIETDLFPRLVQSNRLGGRKSSGYFIDIGLPETLETARAVLPTRKRPAVFFDRDGVLNVDKNYVYRIEDWDWVDGAREAIRYFNDLNYAVIVVTNQAGVGRGFYNESDVWKLHTHIAHELMNEGAFIDAFFYAPHHPDAVVEAYQVADHPDRKPNPGMISKAARAYNIDLKRSLLIGDKETDLDAAKNVGVVSHLFEGGNLKAFIDQWVEASPYLEG